MNTFCILKYLTVINSILGKKLNFFYYFDVCLFVLFSVLLENVQLMEISSLSIEGWKFKPLLGAHVHWAVGALYRATPTVTREAIKTTQVYRDRDSNTGHLHNCCGFLTMYSYINWIVPAWWWQVTLTIFNYYLKLCFCGESEYNLLHFYMYITHIHILKVGKQLPKSVEN